MTGLRYLRAPLETITLRNDLRDNAEVPISIILEGIYHAHSVLAKFSDFDVDVPSILGMRNLSAFVGELYARSIVAVSNELFISNPHQDGYPDLLMMDDFGKKHYSTLEMVLTEKQPFSPFVTGGLEVKATCGSVPTPAKLAVKGIEKPGIGDQRISLLTGYDWKAHHRETNNLLSVLWDFIDGQPTIVAVFFANNLTESDWGKIVHPKDGGGRTTSISIMNRQGVKKMYDGTLAVLDDPNYIEFLDRYNKSDLLSKRWGGSTSAFSPIP